MPGQAEVPASAAGTEVTLADGLDLLRAEHLRLQGMLAALGGNSGSSSANVYGRRRAADALVAELRTHLAVEQQCLRPMLDELPDGGQGLVELQNSDADQVNDCMRTLLEADPMGNTFPPAAAHLRGHVERHIARQEEQVFPRLFESAGPDRLVALGERLRAAREGATGVGISPAG